MLINCKKYSLPFEIVSLHEEYWQYVMSYVLQTVKSGLTPHPDMMCNKIIKFGFLKNVGVRISIRQPLDIMLQ